ncbi:hypothetical protein bsdtb5_09960 [Anaeromicropila herbilytica]|uniref:Cell wall-active antibiotics response LiaF-like C-terminal domain-containing protein n=1 Tax=Anaeromicropila herbilytica TaxID=2785025 RepID=A0A7R7EJ88_9FIRM|nr:hypothetical protein bsdtb5_09960 [Anaeromicropila herbilytica]
MALDALNIFEIHLMFRGYWTLFIIIPCLIGLIENKDKMRYIVGLGIGIMLLLSSQHLVSIRFMSRLIGPFILVVIGISLLGRSISSRRRERFDQYREYQNQANGYDEYYNEAKNNSNHKSENNYNTNSEYNNVNSQASGEYTRYQSEDGKDYTAYTRYQGLIRTYTNILSGRTIRIDREEFFGANITSILGGMDLDLRNAIITKDVVIEANCILGGVDIYLPSNVKVVVNSTPILGGVDVKAVPPRDETCPILYVNATCVLGGMDIK